MRNYLLLLTFLLVGAATVFGQAFTDVTTQSGIDHVHHVGDFIFGGGVAVIDYDNDGLEDLFMTGGIDPDVLYKNNGDGTFTDVTIAANLTVGDTLYTMGACAADIDNDGDQDLFVTTRCRLDLVTYTPNILYLNNGDGTFTDITVAAGLTEAVFSTSASFGDYNLDGFVDLAVANFFEDSVYNIFHYSGTYYVNPPADGKPNLLYLNNGNNTFTEVGAQLGVANDGASWTVAFTDYDNDSDLDLIVGNDFGYTSGKTTALYRNEYPLDSFTDVSISSNVACEMHAMGTAVGDYNADGWLDYYLTDENRNRLYGSLGNGTFDSLRAMTTYCDNIGWFDSTASPPMLIQSVGWGAMFMDYDQDTYLDLFVSNGTLVTVSTDSLYNPNVLYKNNGVGFIEVSDTSGLFDGHTARGSAMLDYDNDGDLDIVTVEQTYAIGYGATMPTPRARLYENNTNDANHWLKVKLRGVTSNRDGLGARVRIVVGGGQSMIREVDGGSSSMSSNTHTVHFGIGQNAEIDSLIVIWPGGATQVRTFVHVDQTVTIVEGAEEYVWTGLINNDWHNLDNWNLLQVPNDTNDVIIIPGGLSNYPSTASIPVELGTLVVRENGSLDLTDNFDLTINRNLTLEDNASITAIAGSNIPSIEIKGDIVVDGILDLSEAVVDITDPTLVVTGNGDVLVDTLHVTDGTIFINNNLAISEKMTVKPNGTVIVNGQLKLDPGAVLSSGEDTPEGGGTLIGNISAMRNSANYDPATVNLWSTPVQGQDIGIFTGPYEYLPANAVDLTPGGLLWGWMNVSGNMIPGKGYAIPGAGIAVISGVVNDAPIHDPIQVNIDKNVGTSNNNPWNAVGNPFPEYLDAKDFLEANGPNGTGVITGSVYAFDDDETDGMGWYGSELCAVYNPYIGSVPRYDPTGVQQRFSGYFALGQGFFVEKIHNGTHQVKFDNSMRSGSDTVAHAIQVTSAARMWFGVSTLDSTHYCETLIALKNDATDGFDPLYDAKFKREIPQVSLSSYLNGDQYAIQTLAKSGDYRKIPLYVKSEVADSLLFSVRHIEQLNSRNIIILQDRETGKWRNLIVSPNYRFGIPQNQLGQEVHRFNLHILPPMDIIATAFDCTANERSITLQQPVNYHWTIVVKDASGAAIASTIYQHNGTQIDGIPAGNYNLEFTDTFGYQITHPLTVDPIQTVTAGFTSPVNSVTGETVSFTNNSLNADSYLWDFGDGSAIDSSASPTHIFDQPGTYTISLTAYNADCEETITKSLEVSAAVSGLANINEQMVHVFATGKHLKVQAIGYNEALQIKVYNSTGQQVLNQTAHIEGNRSFDLSAYANGVYIVHIGNGQTLLNKHLMLAN